MPEILRPENADQLREVIAWAVSEETPLEVQGAGTKRGYGRPLETTHVLDVSGLSGISAYEPEELVLTAGPGTPISVIEAAISENKQMLAFEPPDLGPLYGREAGSGTIGGALGCNLSGPRRFAAGAARDHLLGFSAVSGRGEVFKAGGRVVKNVTGYDLSKLMAGSFGTLAVMTEVTVRLVPAPEKVRTILVAGLSSSAGLEILAFVAAGDWAASGLAFIGAELANKSGVEYVSSPGAAVAVIRIEGTSESVLDRASRLRHSLAALAPDTAIEELHRQNSSRLWQDIRDAAHLQAGDDADRDIWRLSIPPADANLVTEIIDDGELVYDWGGALIWYAPKGGAAESESRVRAAINKAASGHATLLRASSEDRAKLSVFQPQPEPVEHLNRRIKDVFDPTGVLDPGRMIAAK